MNESDAEQREGSGPGEPEISTTPASPAPEASAVTQPNVKPRRSGVLVGGLALILAVAAAAGSGYLWYTIVYEHPALLKTDVVGKLDRLDVTVRELRGQVDAAEQKIGALRETQDVLREGFTKIEADVGQRRTEWILAEAEQLLVIANHRLQLARDIDAALAALRAADRQLTLLSNPNLLPVRRELAREITALESLEKADITGITLRLGSLADTVDRFPLVTQAKAFAASDTALAAAAPPEAAPGDWRRAAASMWQDIVSLVRIRHDREVQYPLLPPEQQYFLRENLRLMLFGAQQSIMQGNVDTYRQNLNTAARWLREHFDVDTQVVSAALAEIEKLEREKLVTELPDISISLDKLRNLPGKGTGT